MRRCAVCGCSLMAPCVSDRGACQWVAADLCSDCVGAVCLIAAGPVPWNLYRPADFDDDGLAAGDLAGDGSTVEAAAAAAFLGEIREWAS